MCTVNQDFCQFEIMNVTCDENEILNFNSARYGRMRLGSCIAKDYGYAGCSGNVLDIMDSRCSGRRSCAMSVASLRDKLQPCPEDLTAYLEVNYTCSKGKHDLKLITVML